MAQTKKTSDAPVFQVKITLEGSKPPIWRRLLVPSDVTLSKLHRIIQAAMGWWESHLHQFIVGETYYGETSPEYDDWQEMRNERRVKLHQIAAGEGARFRYEYDFGDDWLHQVTVEKVLPADPEMRLPLCLKGKRSCPPEDVGGVWGYENFLEAIRTPDHPEHAEYLEWIGGEFDAEAFDLDAVNARLRGLG